MLGAGAILGPGLGLGGAAVAGLAGASILTGGSGGGSGGSGGGGTGGTDKAPATVNDPDKTVTIGGDGTTESDKSVTVTGTGEPGASVSVEINGNTETGTVDPDGNWSVTFEKETYPGEGSHKVDVTVTDPDGELTELKGPDVIIDTTPPDLDFASGVVQTNDAHNESEHANGVTLTGVGEAGATLVVTIDGNSHSTTVDESGNWSVTFDKSELATGEYTTTATFVTTDGFGNSATYTADVEIDTQIEAAIDDNLSGGVLPSLLLRNYVMQATQQMQNVSAQSNRVLQEVLSDLETVKTQRAEDRFRKLWAQLGDETADRASSQRGLSSILTFWAQAVQQATYISAVVACTYLVFAGDLTVGAIIAVSILTSRTLAPLTQLSATLSRWSNVKAALDSLGSIVEAPQDVNVEKQYLRRDTVIGALELREVQYRHGPEEPLVLDIPAAVIKANETIAVLGSNGAGKSTLLRLLAGLYTPTRGSLILDGADVAQIASKDLRRVIGYLGQEVRLFNGTLRENLNLSLLHSDDDHLFQALDFAGLGQFVKEHAHGLDLPIYDGGHGLSIGQRQSIGWARLWLQDPKICLLDEPTAALDQTLESTLISRLETWLQGRTAVIATHRVPILSLGQRTMIIQNGRLAVDGPRDAVLAHLKTHRAGDKS